MRGGVYHPVMARMRFWRLSTLVDRFNRSRWVQLLVGLGGLAAFGVLVFGPILGLSGDDAPNDTLTLDRSVAQEGARTSGGYGPTRTTLDGAENLVGFLDGPHFNSISNTKVYGNELAFLDAKRSSDSASGGWQDRIPGADGRYRIRAYIVNGANDALNDQGTGQARNTRIRFELPDGVANGFTIQARISADNAVPTEIYDVVTLLNEAQTLDVDYVAGSARIYNAAHPDGLQLPDGIVDEGVVIGFGQMDGVFPAGYPSSAFVVIEVDIVPSRR